MAAKRRITPRRRKTLHGYFVPSHRNNYQPHFFEWQAIAINIAIVIALFLLAHSVQRLIFTTPSQQVGAVLASVLVDLANDDRATDGLSTLSVNPTLQEAAQRKADDMAAKGYFAHESPEGKTPWYCFGEVGYDFRFAGENLAVYFSDSVEVERAWMNSPKHRANILNSNFTEIGIALAHGAYEGHETTFVVQMFGSPAGASAATVAGALSESGVAGLSAGRQVAGASAEALDVIIEDDTFIAVRNDAPIAALTEMQPVGALKDGSPNPFWKLLSSPKTTLQYMYMALAALILFALILLVAIESRRLHIPSLLRGLGVLVLIGVLLWSGMTYFGGELLIV